MWVPYLTHSIYEAVGFDLNWQQSSSVLPIFCYVLLMVAPSRLVFLSAFSWYVHVILSGWIRCTTWLPWRRRFLLFSRDVGIFSGVTWFLWFHLPSFPCVEQMPWTKFQHLENPFPSRSLILYWHSILPLNGTHRILLLLGSYGMALLRCFSMWRKLVPRIFVRWGRQVHC